MAAEAQRMPAPACDQTNFASAWVITWRGLGGIVRVNAAGGGDLSWPLSSGSELSVSEFQPATLPVATGDERRGARRAMLAMLDAAGPAGKAAVFAHAAVVREG